MGDDALGTGVSEPDVAGGYDEASKARLKAELRARGLDDGGSTADLVERLREDDPDDTEPSQDDAQAPDDAGPSQDDAQAPDDAEPSDAQAPEDDAPVAEDEAPEPRSGSSGGEPGTAETDAAGEAGSEGDTGASRGAQRRTRTGRSAGRRRRTTEPPTRRAARFASRSTGLRLDTVSKTVHEDGRWYIQVELVEVPHVPPSRDILGTYVVIIDDDGDVRGLERMGQHRRRS